MPKLKIAASLLAGEFINLERDVKEIEKAGIDLIHLDVMDGHYVPEITFGRQIISTVMKLTKLPIDIHLAVTNIDHTINGFMQLHPRCIFIHPETSYMPIRLLENIAQAEVLPGIAVNPTYPIDSAKNLLEYYGGVCDVLFMSVEPGYGGQPIMHKRLQIAKNLRPFVRGSMWIDGGINPNWAIEAKKNGVDGVVSGTYVFNDVQPMKLNVDSLRGESLSWRTP
ncbi:ribulose-phosphate 3-epimerase [Alicyclobacillaceae bacterium I2511]|nr:ribulose-phosphate 3-epimerase [Alicyclobacillaceae bacterium I2511]